MYCDLHTHSIYSDGTCTPAQIIAQARALGLTVALTDHNTLAGLPEFLAEARCQGVTAVPGIEYSTEHRGKELHLVGLFIAPEHYVELEQVAETFRQLKAQSNRDLIARLTVAGYPLDYEAILAASPGGNLNRANIAAAMLEKGYVQSIQEAFQRFLSKDLPYYVPPKHLETTDAIRILSRCCAVSVLAHPLKDLSEEELRQALPELMEAGLDGMEVQHSSYDDAAIARATAMAAQFGLLPGGGSDFHGENKPAVRLGTGKGNLAIPLSVYENLLRRKEETYG